MSERDWNDEYRDNPKGPKDAGDNARRFTPDEDATAASGEFRFKLETFEEMRLGTERRELIKGLIPRNGIVVAWGRPKCGKSFWASDAVMHVALGWPYRGRKVQQGAVIYCSFEGHAGVPRRIEAFRKRFLKGRSEPVPFHTIRACLDLVKDHAQLVNEIAQQLGETKPVAVVLDTLNRSLVGSESSDEDMAAYLKASDAIRQAFDCVVIIVHHCGISGDRPRGHTSLTGTVDAQLAVTRDASDNIVVTVEFMKDGSEGETIGSRLEVVEVGADEDGDTLTSCVVVPTDNWSKVPAKKVVGQTKLALDFLRQLVASDGERPPASNHIPGQIRVVRTTLWQRYCDSGIAGDRTSPDSKKRAFVRAAKRLQELGLIGVWDEWVWLADKPDKSGQA